MTEFHSNLWAPWRMEYIRSLDREAEDCGCFLCCYHEHPAEDAANHVICRGRHAFALLNRFPYTNGHLLVAVNRHVGEPAALTDDELTDLTRMTYRAVELLRQTVGPQGFNIGCNLGRCAGAGLPDHLHNHIVPRWSGDTNYMAVLGGVRVIPDALSVLHAQLVEAAVRMGMAG
jgi:ATP adenylyltransferase